MKLFSKGPLVRIFTVSISAILCCSSIVLASGESSTSTSTTTSTTTSTSTVVPAPTAIETSLLYPARSLRFPAYTRLNPPMLPDGSGSGRRIVYKNELQWVWVIDGKNKVVKTMPVSGRRGVPKPGEYQVNSQSLRSFSLDFEGVWFINMTRFALGPAGGNIGFHEIPVKNGKPLQTEEQLGSFLGSGCLRMSAADAKFIFNFGKPGTKVVVVP